jgi:hypothetical protein
MLEAKGIQLTAFNLLVEVLDNEWEEWSGKWYDNRNQNSPTLSPLPSGSTGGP